MNTLWRWFKVLEVAIGGAIALCANSAVAQITPDATLPNNSRVTTQDNIRIIEGGTRSGSNLFHSFERFSVPNGSTAYFKNYAGIQNIISRVTGKSISNINGILQANGTANLFLINPNGIIFGSNASLNIRGSFVASTASSLNFADGTKFSATAPQTAPLLTVSVPTGLQFGLTAAPIRNQSQASPDGATNSLGDPVGLQVQTGKTLALVGGDVTLEGGNLTVASGRIELGSVAGNSLVSLNPTLQGWVLGYEGVKGFQKIQLIQRTVDGSQIPSEVDGSGKDGSSNILVQGSTVELVGPSVSLTTHNMDVGDAGDLTITTRKLIVRDGAQVSTTTMGEGGGGNLTVNASDSVELIGSFTMPDTSTYPSVLASSTAAAGKAGELTINTGRLLIQDGAGVSTSSSGILEESAFRPATGRAGNLNVNASGSVELIGSSLVSGAVGSGDAGKVTIATGQLLVLDGAVVSVSSRLPKLSNNVIYLGNARQLGKAGEINVTARSILLDNQGQITSESNSGKGGDITLQVQDLLLMRHNSQISTSAGTTGASGNGGNITINTPFLVAIPSEKSDIAANAFTGQGGFIQIAAQGIFGIERREKLTPLSAITAFSQKNPKLNGVVQINALGINPNLGLVNLPVEPVDVTGLIAQGCPADAGRRASIFVVTGHGGLPPTPREALRSEPALADLGTTVQDQENHASAAVSTNPTNSDTAPLVEAQGWVTNAKGEVVLVAQAPTVTPDIPWLKPTTCHTP